jgi:hypothetical protein
MLSYYPGISLERLKKTMKNLRRDKWSPGQNFNLRPLKYEAEVSQLYHDVWWWALIIYRKMNSLFENHTKIAVALCGISVELRNVKVDSIHRNFL